jgi:hypothetical protein
MYRSHNGSRVGDEQCTAVQWDEATWLRRVGGEQSQRDSVFTTLKQPALCKIGQLSKYYSSAVRSLVTQSL